MPNDSLSNAFRNNFIQYGVDKVTNTYVFTANANYYSQNSFGSVRINQNYRGLGIRQADNSFRDDQNFSMEYAYPFLNNLSAIAQTNWFYSSDTRTSGNNELNRLNGLVGLRYGFLDNSNIELSAGYEHNRQLSVTSPGLYMKLNGIVNSIRFTDHVFNAAIFGEYLGLNLDRTNTDLDLMGNLLGNYVGNGTMNLNLRYKLQKRDLLSTRLSDIETLPIEERFENNLAPRINLGFQIVDNLSASISMNLINMVIDKSYKEPVEEINLSKMRREFYEFQFAVSSDLYYNSELFTQSVGFLYTTRAEENKAFKKFDISDIDEEAIQELETMRDNISSRTRLNARTKWLPSPADTFSFYLSSSIYRYDTPSEKNYDDRDELTFLTNVSYMRQLTGNFAAGLFAEVYQVHLVFLNASRSAMNNWNRIFRFGPQIKWVNKAFYYNPRFEILANYTAYDFDNLNDNIRSFSFRQIAYRDSLCIYLDKDVNIQSRINIRYYERGVLYWDTFSESPQNSNFEYFIKLLAYSRISDIFSVGTGVRFYSLEQRNIKDNIISSLSFSHFSWGPEMIAQIKFSNGSTISLQGWYEFQYINKLNKNKFPNIYLLTNVSI